jgi:hypothetical protein
VVAVKGALLLVLAGSWVLAQVLRGNALGRLGIAGEPSPVAGAPATGIDRIGKLIGGINGAGGELGGTVAGGAQAGSNVLGGRGAGGS